MTSLKFPVVVATSLLTGANEAKPILQGTVIFVECEGAALEQVFSRWLSENDTSRSTPVHN